MSRPDVDLNESAQVTLDATGFGSVRLGPGRAGTRWMVTTMAVSVAGTVVKVPEIRVYRGAANPGQEVTNSYNGARNSSDGMSLGLHAGEYLTAEWSKGDIGAVATISVFGRRTG